MKLKGQDILKGGKRNLRKRPSERGKDPAFSLWNVGNNFLQLLVQCLPSILSKFEKITKGFIDKASTELSGPPYILYFSSLFFLRISNFDPNWIFSHYCSQNLHQLFSRTLRFKNWVNLYSLISMLQHYPNPTRTKHKISGLEFMV